MLKSKVKKNIFTLENEAVKHQYHIQELVQDLSLQETKLQQNKTDRGTNSSERVFTVAKILGGLTEPAKSIRVFVFAEMFQIKNYKIIIIIAKLLNNRHFKRTVKSILKNEKNQLSLCTKLAKKNALSK